MRWVKSSFCADRQCVEAAFVKSTFSSSGACVEAAPDAGRVLVRDSKDPEGGTLEFSRADWYGLLDAIREGELDDL